LNGTKLIFSILMNFCLWWTLKMRFNDFINHGLLILNLKSESKSDIHFISKKKLKIILPIFLYDEQNLIKQSNEFILKLT
jgi:hypothetical protein